jgi:hypothetical protein
VLTGYTVRGAMSGEVLQATPEGVATPMEMIRIT